MSHPPQQNLTPDQALDLARRHQFNRQFPQAEILLRQILSVAPHRVDVLNELAMLLGQHGHLAEAESLLTRAIQLDPTYLPAWHNLAVAAERRGDYDAALRHLEHASRLYPTHFDTRFRLAQAYKRAARFDDSLREVRIALDLNPADPEARGLRANLLLLAGDFPRAWDEYEIRWQCPSFPDTRHNWSTDFRVTPTTDLSGKHVALVGEQGYGDMIQFVRYAKPLADRGARVSVTVPPDLAPLLQSVPGVAQVLAAKTPPPADILLPMMSLPRAFQTTLDTIPAEVPYITPDPAQVAKWRTKIESLQLATSNSQPATKVGIAWAGRPEHKSDRERTVRLAQFLPLAQIPNVALFMLQKGPAAAQANPPPAGMTIHNLTAGIAHFADTAAFIANLDLVISVDTAIVHLAGALAKPTWTLLQHLPDWRWLRDRPDTPWYPTMKLYRQPTPGDWTPVFTRVAADLKELVSHR